MFIGLINCLFNFHLRFFPLLFLGLVIPDLFLEQLLFSRKGLSSCNDILQIVSLIIDHNLLLLFFKCLKLTKSLLLFRLKFIFNILFILYLPKNVTILFVQLVRALPIFYHQLLIFLEIVCPALHSQRHLSILTDISWLAGLLKIFLQLINPTIFWVLTKFIFVVC